MSGALWNPWHGCEKISAGCMHCYVYRRDASIEKDAHTVTKNADFDLPIRLKKDRTYKLQAEDNPIFTCLTSDFFLEKADAWRPDCWAFIKKRPDLDFFIITKRIARFSACLPDDWGRGYANVTVCCTVENDEMAKFRLPIFSAAPIRHKQIICEPLLGKTDLSPFLSAEIEGVTVGGESGDEARICDYEWVLDLRRQCMEAGVPFHFKQTGARFRKDGKVYTVPRRDQHLQAKKAGIDYVPDGAKG